MTKQSKISCSKSLRLFSPRFSSLGFIFLCALIGLGACAVHPSLPSARANAPLAERARLDQDNLEKSFAQFRVSQVRSVDYELHFVFDKKIDTYQGRAVLNVELFRTDVPLSLDFLVDKIDEIRVNGAAITDYVARKGSFDLPVSRLAEKTTIEIAYTNHYNKDGQGFQKSVDPEDSSEYLFSDFEPYYAHELFPCFDQPDLKAIYHVSVSAPSDWKVIGNALVKTELRSQAGRTETTFEPTPRLSTYLLFLGAGPYVEWKDQYNKIPLVIYARKTLAKYVDAKKLFDTTKKGLAFYEGYFAHPYSFPKFGLIFIPEFAWGGMENPGAIAMNEKMIFRGTVTHQKSDDRDDTVLHEMAHMWFGDLVTMKWWNDLWLNESFATFASSLAQSKALQNRATWQNFFREKTWGYYQDQLVTTHPIEVLAADVESSKSNFDGITYAKGAASLKQLNFFVGEKGFQNGLKSYFQKFHFQNTTRENFVSEIAQASGQPLGDWSAKWLETAGVNRVQADWSCDASSSRIKSFSLIQMPSQSGTLSPHKVHIELFRAGTGSDLVPYVTADQSYSKAETSVAQLVGAACPDFVYPNGGDQDYALFSIDPVSLKFAQSILGGSQSFADPLMRAMIWNTLYQMVRDSQFSLMSYFDLFESAVGHESDQGVLGILLNEARDNYYYFLTPDQRRAVASKLERAIWSRTSTENDDDTRLTFFEAYVSFAQSPEALARIHGFLDGRSLPLGIKVDQDRRWILINALAAHGFQGIKSLIAGEEKRDPSTAGQRAAYGARVAVPTLANKKLYWEKLQNPEIPFSVLRHAAGNFHSANHPEFSQTFVKSFFKKVNTIDWNKNDNLVEIYLKELFPMNLCSAELLSESQRNLEGSKNLVPLAKRAWLEANDNLARCVQVRKAAAQAAVPQN